MSTTAPQPDRETAAGRPAIAMLHGWAMHSGLFEDLAGAWPGAAWTGVDLPGHGTRRGLRWPAEQTGLLEAVLADLPTGGWLLGWSLGGQLALCAALECPGRFEGLILVSATPCFANRPHWPHGVDPALLKAMALELAERPEAVVNRFLALEIHGSAHAREEFKRLKSRALRHGLPDPDALLAGLRFLETTDLTDRLAGLELPVLLIGGRRDRLVPFEAMRQTHRRLRDSRLVRIPGAAHAPFLTDPGAVAGAIRSFIYDARP